MRLNGSKSIKGRTVYFQASVSVEAALALPIFIMFMISFAMLIQVLRTHEFVHGSLINAANSMAIQNYAITDMKKVYQGNNGAETNRLRFSGDPFVDMHEFYYNLEKYNDTALKESLDLYGKYAVSPAVHPISIEEAILRLWYVYEFMYSQDQDNSEPMSDAGGIYIFKKYLLHEFYKRANISYAEGDFAQGKPIIPGANTGDDSSPEFKREIMADALLKRYYITGGFDSIQFESGTEWQSDFPIPDPNNNNSYIFTIRARYEITIPLLFPRIWKLPMSHCIEVRSWGVGD